MDRIPSTTTLLSPATVAEQAGISKPTLYSWISSGLVQPQFDVEGRPVFTKAEAGDVRQLVEERRAATRALQLPRRR